jgi:predicted SprT family Zn-dependent metalloprotease
MTDTYTTSLHPNMDNPEKVKVIAMEVRDTLDKHGFPPFKFEVQITRLLTTYGGRARCSSNTILLNSDYLREFGDEFLNETLPHEIAHLYVGRYYGWGVQPHGREFKSLMRKLKLNPSAYHNFPVQNWHKKLCAPAFTVTVDGTENEFVIDPSITRMIPVKNRIVHMYRGK